MNVTSESMRLYIVTDRSWLGENDLAVQVEESVRAGATFVQLREKELPFDEFVRQAEKIKAVTDRWKVPFVINDDIEVALAVDADGVHIGQGDLPAAEVRRRIGPDKILGVSANTVPLALKAQGDGADYLGVGAVFHTGTKKDADDITHDTLREICAAVDIPVVAIGGIQEGNILELKGAGTDGVAVISAIFAQPDIGAATRRMRALADQVAR